MPPGPIIAAHLLLLPPAAALDAWYAVYLRDEARIGYASGRRQMTHWVGALLYSAVFFAIAIPYIAGLTIVPAFDLAVVMVSVAVGLPAAFIVSLASMQVGTWLGKVGREATASPAPAMLCHRRVE